MTFKTAVENTPDINTCFRPGLKALGSDSSKIKLSNARLCEGSVDIDSCLSAKYHQQNRWDYCFSYNQEVFFIEVHSAVTSEVITVLRKLNWLKDWLKTNAPAINSMKAKSRPPFYWVQSSKFGILPQSKQYRTIVQAGIKPVSRLEL